MEGRGGLVNLCVGLAETERTWGRGGGGEGEGGICGEEFSLDEEED